MSETNRGNAIVSNVIWKFAERILAQSVSLIVSIILARLLLPSDYGAISMVTVFITIANVFITEGIPNSLIQKKDADDIDFSSVFYVNFVLSIVIYFFLYISAPYIANFFNMEVLAPVVRVMGIRVIIASINSVQHAYVARHMIFKKYFWSTLFGTLLSGLLGVILAYLGFGIWALVMQYMINTIVDTVVLFCTVDWRPKRLFDLKRVSTLFSFGWKMLFEAISNTIVEQFQNLIIGKRYTSSDLAYYTKGQQFPNLIVINITSSIGSVLFPAMSNEQFDENRVLQLLRKSSRISYYVVFPMLMGLAVVAKPFISLILTDKWIETVPYLQVSCLVLATNVFLIPRHQALNGTGRSDVYMNEHLIARIVRIVLLLLTFRISIVAILLGTILSSLILCLIVSYTSRKYNGYSFRMQIIDLLPSVIGCIVMAVPTYMIGFLDLGNISTLILQVFCGIFSYVIYSYVIKLEEFDTCKSYIYLIKSKFMNKK